MTNNTAPTKAAAGRTTSARGAPTKATAQPDGRLAAFIGFPIGGLDFYEDLEDDNSRSFWLANKDRYTELVLTPIERLAAEVTAEFGPAKIFRPHRDVRFAKDKSPYKTQQGAWFNDSSRYLHIGAAGLLVAGGYYQLSSDQLARFRRALVTDLPAAELRAAIAKFTKAGLELSGDQLQRVPTGFDKESPQADLLRYKSITAVARLGAPDWLPTPKAKTEIIRRWRAMQQLIDWLDRHVGASEQPARGRR